MCGIAGIWGEATPERLLRMAAALTHRGPDDQGLWLDPAVGIGFAHRRLTIVDPAGGHQPLANEDGRVVTVFNGEIYNYRELRSELTARGHRLVTNGDTETIVHLYEEMGPALAAKLRGMFAIAVWDSGSRELLLFRDRVGKKPLYYARIGGEFLFASEIKGILAALPSSPPLDGQALRDYLSWTVVPAPRTIYQEIRCLLPGEWAVVRDGQIAERRKFWRLRMQPKLPIDRAEALACVDQLLRQAVRLRLRADVPVGCFLSGGIDSGLITAMAAAERSSPITTITVGFEDDAFDERPLARRVAAQYGTDHHEIVLRASVAEDLPAILGAFDQPFADSSAIPSYYVARAGRQLVKSVLNGDGGDELFAGYRRHVAARLNALLAWSDGPMGRPIWRFLAHLFPPPGGFRTGYAFAHRLLRGMSVNRPQRYMAWSVDGFDEGELATLVASGGRPPDGGATDDGCPSVTADAVLAELSDHGAVDRTLAADFAVVLPNDLLVKMDIATMAHGLEVRSPFLDQELIESVARFPEGLKLNRFQTKPLLRALAGRYLPREVCQAPKRGFEVPLFRWLTGELKPLAEDEILARDGLAAELFHRPALERLLRGAHALDPGRWGRRVWILLALAIWDRHVHRGLRAESDGAGHPAGHATVAPGRVEATRPRDR